MQRRGVLLSALAVLLACVALLAAADPRGAASQAGSATATEVHLPLLLNPARPWQRPPSDASWLTVLNAYRANSNLPPVSENSAHSAGCRDHARYIVQTGQMTHDQDTQSPLNERFTFSL